MVGIEQEAVARPAKVFQQRNVERLPRACGLIAQHDRGRIGAAQDDVRQSIVIDIAPRGRLDPANDGEGMPRLLFKALAAAKQHFARQAAPARKKEIDFAISIDIRC